MNTVLINPLFIFSNVVYIKPEKKYILIRRETWNTVVRLVFKRNKPSVVDLRKLKECFYRGYKKWSDNNGKSVDFKSWNKEISDLQNKVTDRKVPDQIVNYVDFKDQPTIKFEDDSFFDDEFLDPKMVNNKLDVNEKQVQLFSSYSDKVEISKQQVLDILNYNVSISPVHKGLIDFLGFGRLMSLSSQIRADVVVKNLSELVVVFLKANPQFLYSCLSFRNISVYFLCQRCGVLNGHSKKYGERTSTMIENHGRTSLLYYYKDLPLTEASVNFNDFNQDVSYPLVSVLDCNEYMSYSYKDICRGYSGEFLNYCDGRELIDIIKLVHLVFSYQEFMKKLEMEISLIFEPHFKEKHFLNTIRFYLDILETDCYRKFFSFHICNSDCNVENCSFLCNYVFQPEFLTVDLNNVNYFKLYGTESQKADAIRLSDSLINNFGAFLNM